MTQLYIDLGNHSIKWVLDTDMSTIFVQEWLPQKQLTDELVKWWSLIEQPHDIWISSVVCAEKSSVIDDWIKHYWGIESHFIQAQKKYTNIINEYQRATDLGSDRWVAAIGARNLYPSETVVIIDAGSAITVDTLLADGRFMGGVILPGLRLMEHSLTSQTDQIGQKARLSVSNGGLVIDIFAVNTDSAVQSGIVLATAGGIEKAVQQIENKIGQAYVTLITGGDGKALSQQIKTVVKYVPELVMQGISYIAQHQDAS